MKAEPYVVGRYYVVPTVHGRLFGATRPWPVLLPAHTDREIIGFGLLHYHLDWRFMPDRFIWVLGKVLTQRPVLDSDFVPLPDPAMRRLKCRRNMPSFADVPNVPWRAELEAAFAHRRCKGKICPHRGVDLSTVAPDVDGCVTCPAHGLRWDLSTGEMARTVWEREQHD